MSMTSSRPYLIRALYEWIVVNNYSPYLLVNATVQNVQVPKEYVAKEKIILNVSPQAVKDLQLGNETIEFNARFGGKPRYVSLPVKSVMAIYAIENGRGMVFNEDEDEDSPEPPDPSGQKTTRTKLKVVK